MPLTSDAFDYPLPAGLIAQHPADERSASRLLELAGETISDRQFSELPELLSPGDLLVFNDTRVIKARLRGTKASGVKIEVLIERVLDEHEALAQCDRASRPPRAAS